MNSDYWVDFWKNYTNNLVSQDEQTQVLRTFNKTPIDDSLWEFTLETITSPLKLSQSDKVLELCCGNGLIARNIAERVNNVTAVDVSTNLIEELKKKNYKNINAFSMDIRKLDFDFQSFDKIVIYAGIQYLNEAETIAMFEKLYKWLKPNGILFVGDIPDYDKIWDFYNSKEREKVFFDNRKLSKDIVGVWYKKDFFEKLCSYAGFKKYKILKQHDKLIYSSFRYDLIATKGSNG